jgi:hypothetical protein
MAVNGFKELLPPHAYGNVSRPAMENMIYTMMMMINISTDGSLATPFIYLPAGSTKAHHIQAVLPTS